MGSILGLAFGVNFVTWSWFLGSGVFWPVQKSSIGRIGWLGSFHSNIHKNN